MPEPTENGSRLNCVPEQSELAGGETILLVEDEKFVREVTEQVLKSAGYKVLTAKNAAEAQVQFSRQGGELDLLLTDLLLPRGNWTRSG
jgi:CheY-like chemotaxis protein